MAAVALPVLERSLIAARNAALCLVVGVTSYQRHSVASGDHAGARRAA
jgi:hypothetical protein